jgi:hypothetical protein
MSRLLDDGSATEYLRIDGVSLAFFNNQNTPALKSHVQQGAAVHSEEP